MPRITEYTASSASQGKIALADSEVFAVDGINGVRKINANKLAEALAEKTLHNADSVATGYGKSGIYRGANLGSGATFAEASTPAQRTAIQNGTFDGLFIGDYWTVNNVLYRIADFNYWKNTGDTAYTQNHVILVPDEPVGVDKINTTRTSVGAYVNSWLNTNSSSILNQFRQSASIDFGSYLVNHRAFLPNAIDSVTGAQIAGAWYDSTIELMNEPMLYGAYVRCIRQSTDNAKNYITTADTTQLALFKLNPAMVNRRFGNSYWLRDTAISGYFTRLNYYGCAINADASTNLGIRPVFAVKGTTN